MIFIQNSDCGFVPVSYIVMFLHVCTSATIYSFHHLTIVLYFHISVTFPSLDAVQIFLSNLISLPVDAIFTQSSNLGHFAEISPLKSSWAERRSSAFTTRSQISPSCVAIAVWPDHRYALKAPDLIKPQRVCQCYSKPFFSTVRIRT